VEKRDEKEEGNEDEIENEGCHMNGGVMVVRGF